METVKPIITVVGVLLLLGFIFGSDTMAPARHLAGEALHLVFVWVLLILAFFGAIALSEQYKGTNQHSKPIDRPNNLDSTVKKNINSSDTNNIATVNKISEKAHQLFGGRTLAQVGAEYDLDDGDVTIGYNTDPKTNNEIASLLVKVNGVKYKIPFSSDYPVEIATASADALLNGTFRIMFNKYNGLDENTPSLLFCKPF